MKSRNSEKSKLTCHHYNVAMGKVNHQQNAVYHCIAYCYQCVQAAERYSVNHVLHKAQRRHVGNSVKKLHKGTS